MFAKHFPFKTFKHRFIHMSAYLVKPTCNSLPMENNKPANQKTTCTYVTWGRKT